MLDLHTLRPSQSRHHNKRVGRGNSSGKGTTAGRGTKGQRARTGGRNKLTRRGLKHLIERTPKTRGFRSRREAVTVMTLSDLTRHFADGQMITPATLKQAGLTDSTRRLKIIGSGEVHKKFTIKAHAFSAAASAAITAAGGKAIVLAPSPEVSAGDKH